MRIVGPLAGCNRPAGPLCFCESPKPGCRVTALSVNVNKVAVLRNSRGHAWPDPVVAARVAVEAGCDGITVHPRPDQRHIRVDDVERIARVLGGVEYNLEGNPFAPARGGYP